MDSRLNTFYTFSRRIWPWLMGLLLLLDLGYSALQHYHCPMDGDMGGLIVPAPHYGEVLHDPLGLKALLKGEKYYATNRFFAHASMYGYYQLATTITPYISAPQNRLYLSASFFKTSVQVLILILMGLYLRLFFKGQKRALLWGVFLVFPLLQTRGFNRIFGVIDPSITYTFFYAWPIALLFLFAYPYFKYLWTGKAMPSHWLSRFFYLLLAFILPFSSPISAPFILLMGAITLTYLIGKRLLKHGIKNLFSFGKNQVRSLGIYPSFLLAFLLLMAAYSYYIGIFNVENKPSPILLSERYMLLLAGIKSMLLNKLAYPILLAVLVFNYILLYKYYRSSDPKAAQIIRIIQWVGIIALIYIALLPFGGYRPYRPMIIKKDVILPIILALFFTYTLSTFYLIENLKKLSSRMYFVFILAVGLFFTISDQPNFQDNTCEKHAITQLMQTKEQAIILPTDCLLMSWRPLEKAYESQWSAKLIQRFGITQQEVRWRNGEQE